MSTANLPSRSPDGPHLPPAKIKLMLFLWCLVPGGQIVDHHPARRWDVSAGRKGFKAYPASAIAATKLHQTDRRVGKCRSSLEGAVGRQQDVPKMQYKAQSRRADGPIRSRPPPCWRLGAHASSGRTASAFKGKGSRRMSRLPVDRLQALAKEP